MSFPRRLGVRLHTDFIKKYHLTGMQVKWMSFEDENFEKPMGKDFYHEDMITREGWANYYFKGKYPKDTAYIRCQIVNASTGMLLETFYFKFQKAYQTSLDARYYITDPVLGNKIVKNGLLVELRQMKDKRTGKTVYRQGSRTFSQKKLTAESIAGYDVGSYNPRDPASSASKDIKEVQTPAIVRTSVRYCEAPKMIFLITPPHLISGLDKYGIMCYTVSVNT